MTGQFKITLWKKYNTCTSLLELNNQRFSREKCYLKAVNLYKNLKVRKSLWSVTF